MGSCVFTQQAFWPGNITSLLLGMAKGRFLLESLIAEVSSDFTVDSWFQESLDSSRESGSMLWLLSSARSLVMGWSSVAREKLTSVAL